MSNLQGVQRLPLRDVLYKNNLAFLKKYSDKKYKIVVMNRVRNKGVEGFFNYVAKGTVNSEKLDDNITRARSKIFEYAFCNEWDFFSTFTISSKFDRYNLETYHRQFSQFLRDFGKKNGLKLKYLTIPEQHKDGAWHEHGFISGLPLKYLELFRLEQKLPYYIRDRLIDGEEIYNWPDYAMRFGYCNLERIKNKEAVSRYVTKYISKDLASSVKESGAHLYYCSKGLKTAELIKKGTMLADMIPDFENEHCKLYWFDDVPEETLKNLIKSEEHLYNNKKSGHVAINNI